MDGSSLIPPRGIRGAAAVCTGFGSSGRRWLLPCAKGRANECLRLVRRSVSGAGWASGERAGGPAVHTCRTCRCRPSSSICHPLDATPPEASNSHFGALSRQAIFRRSWGGQDSLARQVNSQSWHARGLRRSLGLIRPPRPVARRAGCRLLRLATYSRRDDRVLFLS